MFLIAPGRTIFQVYFFTIPQLHEAQLRICLKTKFLPYHGLDFRKRLVYFVEEYKFDGAVRVA